MTSPRHKEDRASFRDFRRELLVRCPSCSSLARLVFLEGPRYRLTCSECPHTRDWCRDETGVFAYPGPGPRLERFELDLWLQVSCCGQTLWAFNAAHVAELEALVGARLRERRRHPEYGWSNSSMASRLPKWVKAAKNRPDVLKALEALRGLAEKAV